MKKILEILLFIICIFIVYSCESATSHINPPVSDKYSNKEIDSILIHNQAAKSHDISPPSESQQFLVDFPIATDVEWEKRGDILVVDFEIEDTDYESYYDLSVNLLMYQYEISESDIPAVVKNSAVGKYPDYNIEEARKIVRGSEIFYKLELKRDGLKAFLSLGHDGVIKDIVF